MHHTLWHPKIHQCLKQSTVDIRCRKVTLGLNKAGRKHSVPFEGACLPILGQEIQVVKGLSKGFWHTCKVSS